ncbi:MAG: SDR family NAD(P)-dependent oxidoreductase [Novosphingobium sp.]
MGETFGRTEGLAVVTGAASGMGEATAEIFARTPGPLLLCDVNEERLAATIARFGRSEPVETLVGDISDTTFPQRLAAAAGNRKIGALVHCAGLSPTMASAERILEVNLAATLRLVEVLPPLMAQNGAAVLFASMAAHGGIEAMDGQLSQIASAEDVASLLPICQNSGIAYSVSKRAVLLLARRLAAVFGKNGSRVTTISPGIIDTPMGRQEMEQQAVMNVIVESSALKRPATAVEVANVAAFLCSPAASFVSGIDVPVDGGAIAAQQTGAVKLG